MLRSTEPLVTATHAGAVIACFHAPQVAALAALACWGVVLYLAVRVRLDAGAFEAFADGDSAEAFDRMLAESGLRGAGPTRQMEARRRGAVRLWKMLVAAAIAQLILSGLALL